MRNYKILFIATAFSPENAMGSVRTTKIVKYLVRNQHEVTVVSPQVHEGTKIDYSLESKELKQVDRIVIPQSKFFSLIFLKKRNKMLKKQSATDYLKTSDSLSFYSRVKSQFFIFVHFIYTIIRNMDWYYKVVQSLNKKLEAHKFDVVISSYPSLGAHWAAKHISKKNGLIWIADFRDPVNYESNSNKILFNLAERIQNSIVKYANYVTYVTEGMIERLNRRNKFDSKKFIYLPNGFDSEDSKEVNLNPKLEEKTKLVICYMGSLYGGKRDLSAVFEAIQMLIHNKLISEEQFIFYYAGKEFNVLLDQASKYNLQSILINKNFITREESIKLQNRSDLIVVASWNSKIDSGIIPGKLYECFLLNKKVLGIVNGDLPNSEMKNLIIKVNGGYVYEDAALDKEKDFTELMIFIEENYKEKLALGFVEGKYSNEVSKFEYSYLTEKLIGLFPA